MLQPQGFDILYEQGACLVVNKPGGLLTQAPPHIDSLEVRVKEFLKLRDNKHSGVYLGVPHRLDRPVSGALVLGKHVRATRRTAEQFEGRTVRKIYWGIVQGQVDPPWGRWVDRVRKIPDQARAEVLAEDDPEGREAVLHYRVLRRETARTWLEFDLQTGRFHQIRLQSAHRGHPLLGDLQYGATEPFGPQTEDLRQRWIALHARCLVFRHPMTDDLLEIVAPLPSPWDSMQHGLDPIPPKSDVR